MTDFEGLSGLLNSDHRDVLSVALDIDPTKPEHQSPHPAYRTWLREAFQRVLETVPKPARAEIRKAARRALARVQNGPAGGRGLMLLAGRDLWREFVLPDSLPNRVHYGRPDLLPLLWAARMYKPWVTVLVDRTHAKIAVAFLEKTIVVHEESLTLDTGHWRFKAGRPRTATKAVGVAASRGVERDSFTARVDDHVYRFWQSIARTASRTLADLSIDRVIIAGPERATNAVRESLPERTRAMVVGIVTLPPHPTIANVREHTLPVILAHAHRRESRLLADLRDRAAAAAGGVLGRSATLETLLRGEVMTLVAERDLDGSVWECTSCAYVAVADVNACPSCGAQMKETSLRQVVPFLAHHHGAALEVVGPTGRPSLPEGLGGLLRYTPHPESAKTSPSALADRLV
jgi:hypothetical protein